MMLTMKKEDGSWDLSPLYKTDDDPQIASDLDTATRAYEGFAKKWRERDDYLSDPIVLCEALGEWEMLAAKHGPGTKASYYFGLRSAQEAGNPELRARLNRVTTAAVKNANTVRFFVLKLGAVSADQQRLFLTDIQLQRFQPFLIQLFESAKHSLTEGEEKVFSLLAEPAYGRWTEMVEAFLSRASRQVSLSDGEVKNVPYGGLDQYLIYPNRDVRLRAEEAVNSILTSHVDVAENELNAILETKKVGDELRGYTTVEQERLTEDMISQEVVDAMIQAVVGRFDIPQRFFALKAQLLGQKQLTYGERNVGYGELDASFTFDDSVEVVDRTLRSLDPEFAAIFRNFVGNRRLDVFPRSGKRSGAFCAFDRIDLPVYILLNHTNTLRDVMTLAHEVGHGINDELVRQNQTALYAHTPLSTAEVASTFMEDFTLAQVADGLSKAERLSLLIAKLNDDIATIFRQVAAFQFERELHTSYRREGYLSKEKIGEIFQSHMSSYLGRSVQFLPEHQNWWVGWHHFRRPFYVYSYASGLLISKALQQAVRNSPAFITDVKTFLGTGVSSRPEKIFQSLGIEITDSSFWLSGLELIDEALKEAEALSSA